jgi:anaerobic selenocysteine-containing dehydrogenase
VSAATHFRTCNLCEAMCGVAIETDGGRVRSIRGDPDDPFSRGHICPKAVALGDIHEDPDRVRRPLRRRGRDFEEISWEEALAETAERLHAVQKQHGRHAVAFYQGNPTVHNHGAVLFGQLLAKTLRTRSMYSATSVDQLPHMLASLLMFGHQLLLPVPDVDRTDFMLMLGANPLASNGSLMTAPGIGKRLKALRARGGRLVVVDPRRTETANVADQHLGIRPGTDAFLLLAILQVLFAERLVKPGRLEAIANGLDAVAALAAPFTPDVAAGPTGIPAETIAQLARAFAAAPTAVCYGRVGVSTQAFGGLACWLVNVVNVVTGNLDRAGGAMFPLPAVDLVRQGDRIGQRGHFARRHSRVRGLPEFGGEWPAAVLAEEIDTPGDGQVRALVTSAGNPVLSTPNGQRLDRALATLEFMVSIDIYVNETTRHAHLILPTTAALEHDHYDVVFHALAVRNTAKYSKALFDPGPDARHDWQILLELSRRLRAHQGGGIRSRLLHAGLARTGTRGLIAALLRTGPYGLLRGGLSLARLEKNPHGIDLGPLQPCLPERLYTRDRRIDLVPAVLVADLARLQQSLSRPVPALQVVGRRDVRSNNSWMHNSARLVKGPDRCTVLMHPADAAARGLAHGDRVTLRSRAGAVEAALEVTSDMTTGVVSLPHGWGHGGDEVRLRVARTRPGVSLNDVTDEQVVDALCGTAAFSGVAVEVERAAAYREPALATIASSALP